MKQIVTKIIFFIFMIMFINCIHGVAEPISKDKIKNAVIKFDKYDSFIIKFSNLIYEVKGEDVKVPIPIFRGNMGDITYKEFRKYCVDNKLMEDGYRESGFIIDAKKGEVKKTFHEFLRFYQKNLFKDVGIDVNRPSEISNIEPGILNIHYDFKVKGVPMLIKITIYITSDIETDKIKSVFDIDNIDEDFKTTPPHFYFEIY